MRSLLTNGQRRPTRSYLKKNTASSVKTTGSMDNHQSVTITYSHRISAYNAKESDRFDRSNEIKNDCYKEETVSQCQFGSPTNAAANKLSETSWE
mmetsp:Transcript_19498/g.31364  ORF Transcript_19498/g.31364 Transcript_19498/m.31364 type:complete len:95 (-) Transcript_19498:53-337(-)